MQTVLYDGSLDGFLCAVFDVYEYKFTDAEICSDQNFNGNIFMLPHQAVMDAAHSDRVWKGLEKKLSSDSLEAIYKTFLSEIPGIENTLLQYIRYCFSATHCMEQDFSNDAVLAVSQTARKVWREKHRMEAFVRFQKTKDGIYYAVIEPDYNVLPLIEDHFKKRYADQQWMIYDGRRRYGIFYDGATCNEVSIAFNDDTEGGKDVQAVHDQTEAIYQQLWQQYFKSVNIAARKNTRLHVQHMPRRYWKYLVEKKG